MIDCLWRRTNTSDAGRRLSATVFFWCSISSNLTHVRFPICSLSLSFSPSLFLRELHVLVTTILGHSYFLVALKLRQLLLFVDSGHEVKNRRAQCCPDREILFPANWIDGETEGMLRAEFLNLEKKLKYNEI